MIERNLAAVASLFTFVMLVFFCLTYYIASGKKRRVIHIRERLKRDGFPAVYEEKLSTSFRPYRFLNAEEKFSLQEKILRFLEEKNFHGIGEFEVTDPMKLFIAAEACLLILKSENGELFPGLSNIYLTEDAFIPRENPLNPSTGKPSVEPRLGESWKRGPIVLSWAAVEASLDGTSGKQNVVAHEFAHQLDQQDGSFDGTPELPTRGNVRRWVEVMSKEFLDLRASVGTHHRSDFDAYGATNEAEFFAVVSEYFFMDPKDLKAKHPAVFEIFLAYFGVDPTRWAPN